MDKLVIKKGTKQIDSHQYEGRDDIEELIIADTVEVIGEAAFYGCSISRKSLGVSASTPSAGTLFTSVFPWNCCIRRAQ